MTKINIEGLDKSLILASLYNAAKFKDEVHFFDTTPVTADWAANFLVSHSKLSNMQGKAIMVDLSGSELDISEYDKFNGAGKGAQAIERVKTFVHNDGPLEEKRGAEYRGNGAATFRNMTYREGKEALDYIKQIETKPETKTTILGNALRSVNKPKFAKKVDELWFGNK